jgi:hypothetical protein
MNAAAMARKRALFASTAVLCVALPGFASVKAVLIAVMAAWVLGSLQVHLRSILWFLSVLLNLGLCCEVGLLRGVPAPDILNETSRMVLFFLVLGAGAALARSSAFDSTATDGMILVIASLSALLKVVILGLALSGWMTLDAIQERLGFESVTDTIGFGFQRLQFPSDIAFVFLIVAFKGGRTIRDMLFLVSVTVCIFLSFSRYLFAAFVMCLLIRFLRIRKMDAITGCALCIAVLLGVVFSTSLANRFGGEGAQVSDDTRSEQIRYLKEAIAERPMLGGGMGASVRGYLRSETLPFSYEVQWFALAMQMGFAGLGWFLVNLVAVVAASVRAAGVGRVGYTIDKRRGLIFAAVFALWVAAGFTNPFIISLGSAFGLSTLAVALMSPSRPGIDALKVRGPLVAE